MQSFEIIGEITDIEIIAVGNSIREIGRLRSSTVIVTGRSLKELL